MTLDTFLTAFMIGLSLLTGILAIVIKREDE